jgi:hypothetical protein
MANKVKIKVKQTGRVRAPNLQDPQLAKIGNAMVAAQLDRWSKAVNADGVPAKKLSVRYAIIKQKYLHKRAFRDNKMTGLLVDNFKLRKAANGMIRAENSTRLARQHATSAAKYDQLIGFAVTDARVVFAATQAEYGEYVKRAWIPLDGTRGNPAK